MANTTGKKFGGRKKGTPNKETKVLRERINTLLEDNWNELTGDLKKLKPKERIDTYTKLLEYSLPKLSRIETTPEAKEIEDALDFSMLTDEELELLDQIVRKATKKQKLE